ncbi:MAG TPA: RodZ domain-containing protein [Bacillota bacterium]
MKEIGEYLHRVREEKNISLKEVQESTKISLRYLEAIDKGDFESIPGEVYRKGFLVNYATALGLDGQDILKKYYELKAQEEEQQRKVQLEQAIQNKNTPVINLNWSKEVYLGIVAVLIASLIIISFFAFPSFNNTPYVTEEEAVSGEPAEQPVEDSQGRINKQLLPAPIAVYASFKEAVWVSVKADGVYLYTSDGTTIDPSSPKLLWTAQRELEIRLGNPAGVNLSFNGKDMGKLGERGVVKLFKFTPKGLVTQTP